MKKINQFALGFAIALTGALGFSGCSSSDDVVENNPNYNPDTKEVLTNFVFNVSTSNSPAYTRQSAYDTQANVTTSTDFRGITNAELLSFKLMSGSSLTDGKTVASTLTADKIYSFGTILGAGKLDPTNGDASTDVTKSHRVIELSLPTETNTLMLYGKAIKTGSDNAQGKITWNVSNTLSDIKFSLCRIVPDAPETSTSPIYQAALLQYENLIANVMTEIIRSKVAAGEVSTFVNAKGETETNTLANDLNWSDFVNVSSDLQLSVKTTDPFDPTGNTPMSALGDILSKTFVTLNTIYPNELRAGSGKAITYMTKDLMAVINSVVNANPVSLQEVVAQKVAAAIKTNVEKYFDPVDEYNWRSAGVVKTALTSVLSGDKDKVNEASNLNQFPLDFNLPSGSVILQFQIAKNAADTYDFTYVYANSVATYAMGSAGAFDPKNYVYPAELCYFGNSPLRVSNNTKVSNDYPDGVADWNTAAKWGADWTAGGHVLSTTRSVAMQYNINYGTALLATTVRYGAQSLQDNNANIQKQRTGATEVNNVIDVSQNDTHFQLTGILVGGQEPEVGWNYIAKSATPGFGSMVYDNCGTINIPQATAAAGGEKSTTCYTLLWDNWQESLKDQKQRDVYVALEFKNNSAGFWGENNFIRNDATFYIVGKLDPDKGHDAADYSDGITWPDNQALPPYNADGTTIKQRRVFIQDFMTTADFVIGPTSLQHALVSVPDLRSGQISLGLSVDLKWQTGLTFNNVILGDN
jgi:hypothetical protein